MHKIILYLDSNSLELYQQQKEYVSAIERELYAIDLQMFQIGDLQRLFKIFMQMVERVNDRKEQLLKQEETERQRNI